jgi:putative membrane protein
MTVLEVARIVVVALAALLHIWIFVLESIRWMQPRTWRMFGVRSEEQAEILRPMAYNQGFYNLFLAVGALAGLVLLAVGLPYAGRVLVLFATASMTAAAVVLTTTGPGYLRAALIQGTLPLIGFVLFLF